MKKMKRSLYFCKIMYIKMLIYMYMILMKEHMKHMIYNKTYDNLLSSIYILFIFFIHNQTI